MENINIREPLYHRTIGPLAADKYAFTMAAALFEAEASGEYQGLLEATTSFQLFVRKLPRNGIITADGQTVRYGSLTTAGLPFVQEWLEGWRFSANDLRVLSRQLAPDGKPLFSPAYLEFLSKSRLSVSIDAMPDGSLAFENQPILRVKGPLYQCLMLEASLINLMSSTTLYTTHAAAMVQAAGDKPVWEFSLRRGQDHFGLAAAYGAYVAGAAGTSNLLADKFFNIPSAGTMAHAFVMLHVDEISAFKLWAKHSPTGVYLVDTFDTISGIQNAIDVCKAEGVPLCGVRLDSGDLAYFAKESRKMLDAAGFTQAIIFAQNDLDPAKIESLRLAQAAPIDTYAVGTWLGTAQADPALSAVFKLASVQQGDMLRKVMKFSEDRIKTSLPGTQDVLRMRDQKGMFVGDVMVPERAVSGEGLLAADIVSVDPAAPEHRRVFPAGTAYTQPIQPFMRDGKALRPWLEAEISRRFAKEQRDRLDPVHHRQTLPHRYVSGLSEPLYREWADEIVRNAERRVRSAQAITA